LAIIGCDEKKPKYARQAEVLAVEDENATLRDRVEILEATLAEVSEQLALISSVYQVKDGEAVIEGTNLHIRSGDGRTECIPGDQCTGKGNLIIGYDEPRHECIDSDEDDGRLCSGDHQCGDGTCAPVSRPHKTGSHNLVVGQGHSYSGFAGVVFGESSTVSGSHNSVLGGGNNNVSGYNNAIVGGAANVANGNVCVVVGGDVNEADGARNVVLGGFENKTRGEAISSVILGHHGHESTSSAEIAPDIQSVQRPWEDWEPGDPPPEGQR
jgi:hypothetical protein